MVFYSYKKRLRNGLLEGNPELVIGVSRTGLVLGQEIMGGMLFGRIGGLREDPPIIVFYELFPIAFDREAWIDKM